VKKAHDLEAETIVGFILDPNQDDGKEMAITSKQDSLVRIDWSNEGRLYKCVNDTVQAETEVRTHSWVSHLLLPPVREVAAYTELSLELR
jgi:hypothetical protein